MAVVVVPLAEGCEEMEAVIIIDTLRRAGWEVVAAGVRAGPVKASRGVVLVPDTTWDQVDLARCDAIVLPGGNGGTRNLMADERVLAALREFHAAGKLIAAVCAAPLVLQKAGLLQGRAVTCHPGAAPELVQAERVERRVVEDGSIITSQGPGTTMEFALAIIARVDGPEKSARIAREMVAGC